MISQRLGLRYPDSCKSKVDAFFAERGVTGGQAADSGTGQGSTGQPDTEAVITDGDPVADGGSDGKRRADRLLKTLKRDGDPAKEGIFVGETTFEFDLFETDDDNAEAFIDAMEDMGPTQPLREEADSWRDESPDKERFIYVVNRIGKGRLAQRLAQGELAPPAHVTGALRYLAEE